MLRAKALTILVQGLLMAMLAAAGSTSVKAQDAATLRVQANKVVQLYNAGRYAEGMPLAGQLMAATARALGPDHPDTLSSINLLASYYQSLGLYKEAEPLYKHALTARERVLGKEHKVTLLSVNNLASLYQAQGRYAEAEPLYKRALAASERTLGREHADTLRVEDNLAGLYQAQGRYALAKPLFETVLAVRERVLGKDHLETLKTVNNLAALHSAEGHYTEAERLLKRALDGAERMVGKEHPFPLITASNLGELYRIVGRNAEAEALMKRVLAVQERQLGKDHPSTIITVNNLAELYSTIGRKDEASELMKRALEASKRVFGSYNLATCRSTSNLGNFYREQGRLTESEPLSKQALQCSERVLGKDHPFTLIAADNLAAVYGEQGRYSDAEALSKRSIAASERLLGEDHPTTSTAVSNLAAIYIMQHDWKRAVPLWRRSNAAMIRRVLRSGQASGGRQNGEAASLRLLSNGLVNAVSRLTQEGGAEENDSARETFEAAQWSINSEAAQSMTQMAVRAAASSPGVAALVRERQDLLVEWRTRDTQHILDMAKPAPMRNAQDEAANSARLAAIETRLTAIGKQLETSFPEYASLANLTTLSVAETQALLQYDEALVLFLHTPKFKDLPAALFTWVVTRNDVRWVRIEVETAALSDDVQALRCGLDSAAWAGRTRCAKLLGSDFSAAAANAGKPLPFDLTRAHKLYQILFGQVEDIIKDKHLLVVPSGSLTQLPLHVLVTAPPSSNEYRNAAWLARSHALTVLPAVSSLRALRHIAHKSAATKPFIGFGNPLLDGPDADYSEDAQAAREIQNCEAGPMQTVIAQLVSRRSIRPAETLSEMTDLAQLRMQAPLPETAVELCAVASNMHADAAGVFLGARATERELKALSASGQLRQYQVVHFATHGTLAGEVKGSAEPGLILTPPAAASQEDDGFLSASEIANLNLDADWVILSACNTAAGDATGAPALSGLARAFIYAQARTLLVSHWAVDSGATVKLVTTAVREMSRDGAVGRAEAMRRAMLELIDHGQPREAHPAYWAPFIVAGEGAR